VKAAFVGMGIPLAKPEQVADAVVVAASSALEASPLVGLTPRFTAR
jgi:hypothetical protein